MPTTFVLKGDIALKTEPGRIAEHHVEQLEDFQHVAKVVDDKLGDVALFIRDGRLCADIDTNEASYSAEDSLYDVLTTFLTKHAAEGAVFEMEDDYIWVFGPTHKARWQAEFEHLQALAVAADEALGAWLEKNPEPEA